ncbi:MAG TPA: DUF899 family protein [Thermoanaerobaculia bacterium]|jgi:predicted dithiol-disulfide oxidoreductase (DUF899 family)
MNRSRHTVRFPGESKEYRDARDELLEAEIELRRKIESVASQRRSLPLGGTVAEDYVFDGENEQVRMSQLFGDGKDTLIIYSYMYGPQMKQPCVSCTSILDALDGEAPHVMQRVNLAVIAKSPIERIMQFTRGRGWRNLPLLSSANNTYNRDYHAETSNGNQIPALNVFVRRDGGVHHFYNTELLYAPSEPGQDGRHVDLLWPLWNLFDLTPDGRGEKWYPRLSY